MLHELSAKRKKVIHHQLESNHAGAQSVPNESFRKSLMYYEMRLDRQLTRAFRLLHQLQKPALDIDKSRSA